MFINVDYKEFAIGCSGSQKLFFKFRKPSFLVGF